MENNISVKKYIIKAKIIKIILYTLFFISVLVLALWIVFSVWIARSGNSSFVKLLANTLLRLKVEPATISGINKNGTKYHITSKALKNYVDNYLNNRNINLEDPIISIDSSNGSKITIKAMNGTMSSKSNNFLLKNNVEIKSSLGYKINTSIITFNPEDSSIYSNKIVFANYQKNEIIANGFILSNDLSVITLKGPLTIEID